ncbi:MAG: SDR family oxidoreductase [Sulfuricaulis sp.]|nr:SDR family oxidoreductase [Sulfuricaulis sp.]
MRTVLVTGATGFIGQALCATLREAGTEVRTIQRQPNGPASGIAGHGAAVWIRPGNDIDWSEALRGVEAVIHLAARTHVMRETAPDPLAEYRRVNVEATRTLARAAAAGGVRRFIFLSSIKVNGESNIVPFTEKDSPSPEDAYGQSKLEAERALAQISAASRLETVILRPPLVYGPGVKGNFLRLMRAIGHGVPLPFGAIHNQRSLIYLGNLIDAIVLCLEHPAAAGKIYLLADNENVSTPDLIRAIAGAMAEPARLFPFPPILLRAAGTVLGKPGAVARLLGSLRVDNSRIKREFGWQPRYDLAAGLRDTAEWYHRRHNADSHN